VELGRWNEEERVELNVKRRAENAFVSDVVEGTSNRAMFWTAPIVAQLVGEISAPHAGRKYRFDVHLDDGQFVFNVQRTVEIQNGV